MKNIDVNKYYKSYIIKKLRLDFKEDNESKYYSQKFNSNNILKDIQNIEKIEKNDDIIQPYLIKNSSEDYNYNLEKMYIDMDDVLLLENGLSIILFNTIRCQIKLLLLFLLFNLIILDSLNNLKPISSWLFSKSLEIVL